MTAAPVAAPEPERDSSLMPPTLDVCDPNDPRIEAYRAIRERDLVRGAGFIAEGTVVVERLLASPFHRARSLLVLRNRLDGVRNVLAACPADVPVFVADRTVLDAIAGFPMHRGVLAHGVAAAPLTDDDLCRRLRAVAASNGVAVAAIGLGNHDNVGALFRNASALR